MLCFWSLLEAALKTSGVSKQSWERWNSRRENSYPKSCPTVHRFIFTKGACLKHHNSDFAQQIFICLPEGN